MLLCCCCCQVASVVSNSVRPQRRQPTRLPRPWDSPGKNTGVGCHFLLQCVNVKSESEVTQSCLTLSDPMDCSPSGFSVHGIFQARILEWGAIAFSNAVVNRIFFLVSPSSSLLLVYRHSSFLITAVYWLCILLLYWIHLLLCFFCIVLRFSMYNVMLSASSDSFSSSFFSLDAFFFWPGYSG